MTALVVAHAGHWLVNLLYVLPVAVVAGLLGWQAIKDRREERRENEQPPPAADGDRGSDRPSSAG